MTEGLRLIEEGILGDALLSGRDEMEDVQLPLLPETPNILGKLAVPDVFTADQMREYARQAVADEIKRIGDEMWEAAMSKPPPDAGAGALAHAATVLRHRALSMRAAAIRHG
jgi:hypothetical protein